MNVIELTAKDLETLRSLLVEEEIKKLRQEMREEMNAALGQVLAYMGNIHGQVASLRGEPFVNRVVAGNYSVQAGSVQMVGERRHHVVPESIPDPQSAMEFQGASPLRVATGLKR